MSKTKNVRWKQWQKHDRWRRRRGYSYLGKAQVRRACQKAGPPSKWIEAGRRLRGEMVDAGWIEP